MSETNNNNPTVPFNTDSSGIELAQATLLLLNEILADREKTPQQKLEESRELSRKTGDIAGFQQFFGSVAEIEGQVPGAYKDVTDSFTSVAQTLSNVAGQKTADVKQKAVDEITNLLVAIGKADLALEQKADSISQGFVGFIRGMGTVAEVFGFNGFANRCYDIADRRSETIDRSNYMDDIQALREQLLAADIPFDRIAVQAGANSANARVESLHNRVEDLNPGAATAPVGEQQLTNGWGRGPVLELQ